jgi:hypothetical protein
MVGRRRARYPHFVPNETEPVAVQSLQIQRAGSSLNVLQPSEISMFQNNDSQVSRRLTHVLLARMIGRRNRICRFDRNISVR